MIPSNHVDWGPQQNVLDQPSGFYLLRGRWKGEHRNPLNLANEGFL